MPSLIHPVDPKYLNQWYGEDFSGWIGGVYYERVYRDKFGLAGHPGIDYAVAAGTAVQAAADGVVEFAGWGQAYHSTVGGGSYTMVLNHSGFKTAYLHLTENSNRFVAGQKVKQGDIIARSGATGQGTGAHLHFQYMPEPVNFWDGYWGTRDQRPYLTTYSAATSTIEKDWFDMATAKDLENAVEKAIKELVPGIVKAQTVGYHAKDDKRDMASHIRYPAANILSHQITAVDGKPYQWASYVRWDNHRIVQILRVAEAQSAQLEVLTEAVKALASSKGIDVSPIVLAIEAAADKATAKIDESIASSMDDLTVTLSVEKQEASK